ncbi:tRNA (adenosine(37)-N6)-threonylcarbamoyltransferase complex dimerization subunit type 1 TsaB [Robiginitomaculum antarcticum]|uniref:tRNA (adenosine(37)-N6)-threonylcarbamoyltransferase complex dimerization subunit type 1 TsaB n=1 Tax=Robiginitomaculum antarcticum TaxID=437507 RepID=UPI00035F1E5A|nr:tRNA (adenosine(37)-N6)-threonylcarbamoyltransferase complex dimerization subunit type 1 TsaB [Robiginitomaculum antarcticum]
MRVLALDTTGRDCSAALTDGGDVLGARRETIGRGHAERLGPQVKDLLAEAGMSVSDIDRIAVCTGPGSFTGLRVALAFAKGLALPHSIPVLGISGLWVRAAMADPEGKSTVLTAQGVRRGEIFWQIFKQGRPIGKPILSGAAQAKTALDQNMILTGSAAKLFGGPDEEDYVDPVILARLGALARPEDYPATPLYHRPPDAKLPGGISLS